MGLGSDMTTGGRGFNNLNTSLFSHLRKLNTNLYNIKFYERNVLQEWLPENFIDKLFEKFLNNIYLAKENVATVQKRGCS